MTNPIRSARARCVAAVAVLVLLPVIFAATPGKAASTTEERPAVARLISAAVEISPRLARLEAGRVSYGRVTFELGDALAEGSAPDATTRDWTRCYERGNGAAVICLDGFIEVN